MMPHQSAPTSFRPDRLARLSQMEGRHFWFVGREAVTRWLLRRCGQSGFQLAGATVLDAGCGTGYQARWLSLAGARVLAFDLRPEGVTAAGRASTAGGPRFFRASAEDLPLARGCADAVLALDVIEHLDDRRALAEFLRALRPGGLLLLTVPALPWLWSFRDRDAGHLRRYTRAGLLAAVRAAGFRVEICGYMGFFLLPLTAAARLLGRNGPAIRDREDTPPAWANRILSAVVRLEARLGRALRWPIGASLYLVCQKPLHAE